MWTGKICIISTSLLQLPFWLNIVLFLKSYFSSCSKKLDIDGGYFKMEHINTSLKFAVNAFTPPCIFLYEWVFSPL